MARFLRVTGSPGALYPSAWFSCARDDGEGAAVRRGGAVAAQPGLRQQLPGLDRARPNDPVHAPGATKQPKVLLVPLLHLPVAALALLDVDPPRDADVPVNGD